MKRMIVVVQHIGSEAEDAITACLHAHGWRVWHWLSRAWLVADVDEAHAAEDVWAELMELPGMRGCSGLALDFDAPGGLSGTFDEDGVAWLQEAWGLAEGSVAVAVAPRA